MSVFQASRPINLRPAGESDEGESDDDDLYDMPGFARRRRPIVTPQMNGNVAPDEARNVDNDDNIWDDHPKNSYQPAPNWGRTPEEEMRLACAQGDLDKLKSSLENPTVGVNDFFSDNFTPLMTAAAKGRPRLVEFLISEKADVNQYHHTIKVTPLIAAASCTFERTEDDILKCMKLLFEAGADVNCQDKYGLSALMVSVQRKRMGVVQYLLNECQAKPDLVDSSGLTSLCHAAQLGFGKICRVLLEKGSDVHILDDRGWTAPELANDKGFYRLAELLHIVRDTKWKPGMEPSLMQEVDEDATQRRAISLAADGVTVREDSQIEILLGSLNATKYIDNFRKHRITYLQFLELDEDQLREIGIDQIGIRKKLVDAIREIHNHEWQGSSIRTIAVNKKITAAEAVCMINNIKVHLQYITKTLFSMRHRIEKEPQCLKYSKERNKLQDLLNLCKEMDKSKQGLEKEMLELIEYLYTIEQNAELKLGDEVKHKTLKDVKDKWDKSNRTSKYKWIFGFGIVLGLLVVNNGRIRHAVFNIRR